MADQTVLKLELLFWDRKFIVEDIAKCIGRHDLNITSMEVKNQKEKVLVSLETQSGPKSPDNARIIQSLEGIANLIRISRITAMPSEIRKKRLIVILDSISDGIISIDRDRSITFINPVAKKIHGWDLPNLLGRKITDLPLDNSDILDCLSGKAFHNKKRNIISPQGRFQFFSSSIPITDSTGEVTGAIQVLRDMRQIKEMADEVTSPSRFTFSDIIGNSDPIKDAISFAQKIAPSSSVVSIRGESGTGKELFAKAIHAESGRTGEFVAVNCAALPESLLESELFGYEKGSFTGAEKKGKQGLFEIAHKGTLFLDEIAEMPMGAQAKILRVIQEKSVRRIGGIREIPVDTRIITATSRLIEEMIKHNTFREDLYYRINVLPIHVPPLKERYGDIPLLTDHFLARIAMKVGSAPKKLTSAAREKLRQHVWPGNVRELKNVIERGSIMSDQDTIGAAAIIFGHEIEETIRGLHSRTPDREAPLKEQVACFEKELLESALARYTSIRKCARALKISHTAIINKIKKYQIARYSG
jgi:TyrR family helix-turn-helix protein/PAS domain S-box-containing protein